MKVVSVGMGVCQRGSVKAELEHWSVGMHGMRVQVCYACTDE